MSHGCEVCVATGVDRILRTGFNARVALPAHIGFDVIGTAVSFVDVHDVGRADINAMSATVAARHINKCRHDVPLSPVSKSYDGLVNNVEAAGGHYRKLQVYRRAPVGYFLTRLLLPSVSEWRLQA